MAFEGILSRRVGASMVVPVMILATFVLYVFFL